MMEKKRRIPNKENRLKPEWGEDRGGYFGGKAGPGRPKGSKSKYTNEFIEGMMDVSRMLGGKGCGDWREALCRWALESKGNLRTYWISMFRILLKHGIPVKMDPEFLEIRKMESQKDINRAIQQINISTNMPIPNTPGCPAPKKIDAVVVEPKMIESKAISDVKEVQLSDAVIVESKDEEGWEDF